MNDGPPANAARVVAHAKINLLLRVLAREASGFHGIETVFQAVDLADVVTVDVGVEGRTIHCHGPALPPCGLGHAEDNLAYRAALAYASTAGWPLAWHVDIEKHIPVGGGLGGGSADAAAVLRALETLAPQPIGRERLLEIAGTVGADVPFLAAAIPLALAWGRGDRLLPLPPLAPMAVTLLAFDEGVNTGAAYAALAAGRHEADNKHVVPAQIYPLEAFASWSSIAGVAVNDFESVVSGMHAGVARWLPAVRQAASRLAATGSPAMGLMTGSGATCFVLRPTGTPMSLTSSTGVRVIETMTLSHIAAPVLHDIDP